MFLEPLARRNRAFVEVAVTLHQQGRLPANSYVLDLDTMTENARLIATAAERHGLSVLAMTKQIGRNPPALRAIVAGGIDRFVAVDMAGARMIHANGHRIAHIGHLSQVARAEAAEAEAMSPDFWTAFSIEKASEAAAAAARGGRTQALLARIQAPGDTYYPGHEGGFDAATVTAVAEALDGLDGARFAGITSFPTMLFDEAKGEVFRTPNMATLETAAAALAKAGMSNIVINAPGTTSSTVLNLVAGAGATQIEPGHGLTGTTPLHAVKELPERPAMLYLSEVSHFHAGEALCFGGGLYIDPVFGDYGVRAMVGPDADAVLANRTPATMPAPAAIDYYGKLEAPSGTPIRSGDTVVFGFRAQAFVKRAFVVPISGIAAGAPLVEGLWNSEGRAADWGGGPS